MAAADLPIAESFWSSHGHEVSAGITIAAAIAAAYAVDRGLRARTAGVSVETDTRLRLIRRLIFVAIVVVGVALALAQFASIKRAATGVLASSAVLGLVVGFAARQTLANAIAGTLIAFTQPIRIGDLVTFEEATGTVEDIRLTYTFIRKGDGSRVIVPNERLASSSIQNFTIIDPRVHVEVALYVASDADTTRALAVLREVEGVEDAEVGEVVAEGVKLVASAWAADVDERGALAARIRAGSLERLRNEGLLSSL
ncbi:MAG: mechanosensitive ion channel [Thermoleophilaceae bacterium]|nr:mechanosensitive ion channel [Thermoleophilaceae bacterium]